MMKGLLFAALFCLQCPLGGSVLPTLDPDAITSDNLLEMVKLLARRQVELEKQVCVCLLEAERLTVIPAAIDGMHQGGKMFSGSCHHPHLIYCIRF